MVINRERVGCILVVSLVLNLVGNALAYRAAVYLLCPEPAVSLECFDILRPGMAEDEARVKLKLRFTLEEDLVVGLLMVTLPPRRHELQYRDDDLEIVLVIDNGILTDGRATLNGQVVRHHLEPRDPILDPIRLGLRRLQRP